MDGGALDFLRAGWFRWDEDTQTWKNLDEVLDTRDIMNKPHKFEGGQHECSRKAGHPVQGDV